MKIEILLPTEYINSDCGLSSLPDDLLIDTKTSLVGEILKYEAGVMENSIKGYYKSNRGIITYSNYIVLIVYTENHQLLNILRAHLINICGILKQESIGVIIDNVFNNVCQDKK